MGCEDDTLAYYATHAKQYAAWTQSIDITHLWDKLGNYLSQGARILDLGCGAGRDLKELDERGFFPIGLDFSREFLAEAKGYKAQILVCADMKSIPFADESFQCVWSIASMLHLARRDVRAALCETL
jgi:SAM-dependent methyltransferase